MTSSAVPPTDVSPPGLPPTVAPLAAAPKRSGLAIASLVCGIGGACTCGVTSLIGLILGIVALGRIRRSAGQMGGRGMAIGGIVISVIVLPLVIMVAIQGLRTYEAAEKMQNTVMSMCQVEKLCDAALQYANRDTDGRLPGAGEWPVQLEKAGLIGGAKDYYDPSLPGAGCAYAINNLVAGKRLSEIRNPERTVLFFEVLPGRPFGGSRADLPPEPRYGGAGYIIGFCDGVTTTIQPDEVANLVWDPAAGQP